MKVFYLSADASRFDPLSVNGPVPVLLIPDTATDDDVERIRSAAVGLPAFEIKRYVTGEVQR